MNYNKDFNINESKVWLNCAHQGPLPKIALNSLKKASQLKEDPSLIEDTMFLDVPDKLKQVLGNLFNIPSEEVILTNSASYSIHLLVRGLKWEQGDEILLVNGDFPTNIFPWLPLQKKGVKIRFIQPERPFLTVGDLKKHVSKKSKLLCVSWVNSFDGHVVDDDEIGEFCRKNNIIFALNGSQAFGYKNLDISKFKADVVFSCGSKWLLAPYGTGFAWIRPAIKQKLELNNAYWLNYSTDNLSDLLNYSYTDGSEGKNLDIFATANFLNYMPWTSSLEYISDIGIKTIENYNKYLVQTILENINKTIYKILSP